MKQRAINLTADEVRGLLDGTLGQLRRVMKPQPTPSTHSLFVGKHPFRTGAFAGTPAEGMVVPGANEAGDVWMQEDAWGNIIGITGPCPFGAEGDELACNETGLDASALDFYEASTDIHLQILSVEAAKTTTLWRWLIDVKRIEKGEG